LNAGSVEQRQEVQRAIAAAQTKRLRELFKL